MRQEIKGGKKYPERVMNSSKSAVSLMFSGTAHGHLLPIYVVYKSEKLWDIWLQGGPEKTRYNRSKSGWFDRTCFEDWFETVILPYLKNKPGRKVIIGDNLSSHFSEKNLKSLRNTKFNLCACHRKHALRRGFLWAAKEILESRFI